MMMMMMMTYYHQPINSNHRNKQELRMSSVEPANGALTTTYIHIQIRKR